MKQLGQRTSRPISGVNQLLICDLAQFASPTLTFPTLPV